MLSCALKSKLYNTCILPIFLYGSDCWAISKTDARKIGALNQWCLRMLLGIKWYQFVRNGDVRRLTKQPKLTAIIQSLNGRTLFGQRRCQEDPVSLPSGRLENTTRSSPHHVAQHHPTGFETTPPYAPRSSRFCSELPSVEDDVDVWRYAILELHAINDDDDRSHDNWRFKQSVVVTEFWISAGLHCHFVALLLGVCGKAKISSDPVFENQTVQKFTSVQTIFREELLAICNSN